MDEIYSKYRTVLLADARKRLGDEYLAEDCVEETFMICFEKMKKGTVFSDEHQLASFLFRTNENNAIHIKRDLAFHLKCEDTVPTPVEKEKNYYHDRIEDEEQKSALWDALSSIPINHAVAAYRRYGFGQSYKEISAIMGVGTDSARKFAKRGIRELKEKMKD